MERLRGFVERFNAGPGSISPRSSTPPPPAGPSPSEALTALPLTRAWLSTSPAHSILSLSSSNAQKAAHASSLVRSLSEHLSLHEASARDLRAQVSTLSALRASAAAAGRKALELQTRLVEIAGIVEGMERRGAERETDDVRRRELKRVDEFRERREAEVARKRDECRVKLRDFARERIGVLALDVEAVERGVGRVVVERAEKGLEGVVIEHPEDGGRGQGGLEDFLGPDESARVGAALDELLDDEGEDDDEERVSEKDDDAPQSIARPQNRKRKDKPRLQDKEKDKAKTKEKARGKTKGKGKEKTHEAPPPPPGAAMGRASTAPPTAAAVVARPRVDIEMDEDFDEALQDVWKREYKR